MQSLAWPQALELYTQQVPQEVLRVEVIQSDGSPDLVLIFRGFSSSLMRPTPADLSQPVIAPEARFLRLDRLVGPLDPAQPQVIAADLDAAATRQMLNQIGVDPLGLDSV